MERAHNPFSLSGKKILVTGASSGIGAATALECSKMGASLVITGRNEERLANTFHSLTGGTHAMILADLTDDSSLTDLVTALDPIDGAVLCAGIGSMLPVSFSTRKRINPVFETNFFSQVELLRLLARKKKLKFGASVVGIASIGGIESHNMGIGAYGASKAAFRSLMKTAARELAPKVRVNCILPGQVDTPMVRQGDLTDEQYELYRESVPLKRFAEPSDIALGAVYLLSEASSHITGSDLKIDGGVTL